MPVRGKIRNGNVAKPPRGDRRVGHEENGLFSIPTDEVDVTCDEVVVTNSFQNPGVIAFALVLLDNPKALAEATEVEVHLGKKRKPIGKTRMPKTKPRARSLAERLAPFIGVIQDLPPDSGPCFRSRGGGQ